MTDLSSIHILPLPRGESLPFPKDRSGVIASKAIDISIVGHDRKMPDPSNRFKLYRSFYRNINISQISKESKLIPYFNERIKLKLSIK